MKNTIALLAVLAALGFQSDASRDTLDPIDQWHHWRGPLATGVSPHGDPPIQWSEKKNVKWKVALPGKGSATPIIWGDSIFIAAARDTGRVAKDEDIPKIELKVKKQETTPPKTYHQFMLMCFDRQTGKLRWEKLCKECVPHEGIQQNHSYAAGSPTTDGKRVWVSFGSQGNYCYDFDGKLLWKRDLGLMYTRSGFGEAVTPVLYKDNLILNWDSDYNARLIVLDANTGEVRKQIKRDETTSWNTPLVVEHKGRTQVILNGTKRARGYDLESGELLWQIGGMTTNAIPSPVAVDGVAFIMSGFSGSLAVAVPLDARGDLTKSDKLLWSHKKGTPYVPSPLLIDDKLYFTAANNNPFSCLDIKTGKPHFQQERLNGANSFYASPVAAAGRIYMMDRTGIGLVLKLDTKVEVIATNRLNDKIDASPAVVGRQMFLRGYKYLYCVEESPPRP